jgi:glycosyltransferase involved in cell wall biosynthesis
MRIACTNHNRQLAGGTESYLKRLIPALVGLGHEVSFWHEGAVAEGAPAIDAPEVFAVGPESPGMLQRWKPDLIYNNGLMFMDWEESLGSIAPVVHYAHNYYGTCITGEKTRKFPEPRPCGRCFGAACLSQYFPRRCGGLSPRTMWQDYRLQSQRFRHLARCAAIVTASRHIENEYRGHGFPRVYRAPLFVDSPTLRAAPVQNRILFCGRMTALKGGQLLAGAVPEVEKLIGRPVEVFFAGDGPDLELWRRRCPSAKFTGWISQQALLDLNAGLLVMPSVWPEPFGLAGLELCLPAAAFAVGGIPDWLREGVNGHLSQSLTAHGLAGAIAACIGDGAHFQSLRAGALEVAREFTLEKHLAALLPIFETARA